MYRKTYEAMNVTWPGIYVFELRVTFSEVYIIRCLALYKYSYKYLEFYSQGIAKYMFLAVFIPRELHGLKTPRVWVVRSSTLMRTNIRTCIACVGSRHPLLLTVPCRSLAAPWHAIAGKISALQHFSRQEGRKKWWAVWRFLTSLRHKIRKQENKGPGCRGCIHVHCPQLWATTKRLPAALHWATFSQAPGGLRHDLRCTTCTRRDKNAVNKRKKVQWLTNEPNTIHLLAFQSHDSNTSIIVTF